jgi:hypothetical protein
LPVVIENSTNQQEIDQLQGWTTLFTNVYELKLEGGSRFYSSNSDDQNPSVGTISTQINVYEEAYMNSVLPLNGTTPWATGNHEETTTTYIDKPRLAGAKVGITALTLMTFVGLLMIGIFAKLYCEPDNAANKVAYPSTDDDGQQRLVNPSSPLEEDPQL